MARRASIAVAALAAFAALPARAQFGSLFDSAQRKAADAAAKAASDAMKPKPPPAPAPAPAPAQQQAPAASAAAEPAPAAAKPGTAAANPGAPPPGEVYGNEFDFLAGEKLIFFDDFSGTDVGDYPMKWTTKDGGGNPAEVVEAAGKRFFKSRAEKSNNSSSKHWMRLDVKDDMPQKFTVEFDSYSSGEYILHLGSENVYIGPAEVKLWHAAIKRDPQPNHLQHVAVSVNGTYAKVYVDGRRLAQDPDALARPIKRIGFEFYNYHQYDAPRQYDMMTNFRVAEGGKDYSTELTSAGRIVTHGITFDSGSDEIRPESGPTLRKILKLLQDDPGLRFSIEGHTDNQGGDKVNGPLSERRAAAVKVWLVKQGVAETRLKTQGLGATKPIDSNDTPEGRANNRRVEFVKISS